MNTNMMKVFCEIVTWNEWNSHLQIMHNAWSQISHFVLLIKFGNKISMVSLTFTTIFKLNFFFQMNSYRISIYSYGNLLTQTMSHMSVCIQNASHRLSVRLFHYQLKYLSLGKCYTWLVQGEMLFPMYDQAGGKLRYRIHCVLCIVQLYQLKSFLFFYPLCETDQWMTWVSWTFASADERHQCLWERHISISDNRKNIALVLDSLDGSLKLNTVERDRYLDGWPFEGLHQ